MRCRARPRVRGSLRVGGSARVPRNWGSGRVRGRRFASAARCRRGTRAAKPGFAPTSKGDTRRTRRAAMHRADLQTAYNLTPYSKSNGSGETVAIVNAYDDPNAASDLSRLPSRIWPVRVHAIERVLHKEKYASTSNAGWAEEESLDVDMVSAICPHCKILLVEAASAIRPPLSAPPRSTRPRMRTTSAIAGAATRGRSVMMATTTSGAWRSRPRPATVATMRPRSGRRFCRRSSASGERA